MISNGIYPDTPSLSDPENFCSPILKTGVQLGHSVGTVHSIGIRRLTAENQLWSTKALAALGLSIKVLFAPVTLLAYLIFKSFSKIASSASLGIEAEVRHVDQENRSTLLDLGGEEILFGFDEKPVLEGMFFQANPSTPNAKTILLCTGSHLSYEKYAIPMVEALLSMGHHVMIFNYEGFGNSEGARSEEAVYRSVEAAYQYLKQEKECPDENIVGWGYSLGSGAVSNLALKYHVDIVIDRGFSSMSEVAYQTAPRGLKTVAKIIFIVGAHFDNVSKLKKAQGNIFIAQGMQDTRMREEHHGKLLWDAVSCDPRAVYQYQEVNSGHLNNDPVWFGIAGNDRACVEQFLMLTP